MYAIIGGSGLAKLSALQDTHRRVMRSPYGEPSGALTVGRLAGREVVFLARHGYGHTIAPHEINYRANIWVLKELGVQGVFAVATVGGVREDLGPGTLVAAAFLGPGTVTVCTLAGAEHGQDELLAVGRGRHDLDLARADHVHGVGDVAAVEDHRVLGH